MTVRTRSRWESACWLLASAACGTAPPPEANPPPASSAAPAATTSAAATVAEPAASPPRKLRAAIYPYVPDHAGMKQQVAAAFTAERPGTRLEFVDLDNYYKPDKTGSIARNDADVIEIDSVFLDEEPVRGRLLPLGRLSQRPCHVRPPHGQEAGVALIGYSELLHAYVDEARLKKCEGKPCLDEAALEALPLGLAAEGDRPFVWVDSLGIKSSCTDACLEDAAAFIAMMNRDDRLRELLLPAGGAPRYLMPAKQTLNAELDKLAPYYAKLRPLIAKAIAVRAANLGVALRKVGSAVDQELGTPSK